MNEYNNRQYLKMLECIRLFRSNERSLSECISDIKALMACLESPDVETKTNLQRNWAVLEEVYADSLDRGLPASARNNSDLIDKSFTNMEVILKKVIVAG